MPLARVDYLILRTENGIPFAETGVMKMPIAIIDQASGHRKALIFA